ncbi:glycosyltransferase [Pectobacterium cacticida]|uniref:glycosyltransferase n=1 Tax=Pectobacterium cacticida TaxID=69221 RepID=UPI0035EE374B
MAILLYIYVLMELFLQIIRISGKKLDKSKVILFQRDDNRGLAYSLNELIQLALNDKEIEYLARMDADDIAIDKRLQLQVDFMQSNPEKLMYLVVFAANLVV